MQHYGKRAFGEPHSARQIFDVVEIVRVDEFCPCLFPDDSYVCEIQIVPICDGDYAGIVDCLLHQ